MVETSPESNVYLGSGNIYVDLGLHDAAELTVKTRLMVGLNKLLEFRHLPKQKAAQLLGISQPRLEAIFQYELDSFSIEQLIQLAASLDCEVLLELRPRPTSAPISRKKAAAAA